jgi:hypothetical protein
MRIESGTTTERCIRLGLFLAMCLVFAGWFAYDGFHGYPKENLKWALRNPLMPQSDSEIATNFKAIKANLAKVQPGTTVEQLEALVGPPTLIQSKHRVYVGEEILAIIDLDEEDKVTGVRSKEIAPEEIRDDASTMVTAENVDKIESGMTLSLLEHHLGDKPVETHNQTYWYIGPAVYARFEVIGDAVSNVIEMTENTDHRESDLAMQKWIAAGLCIVVLITLYFLIRAVRTRVVLDDAGLTVNHRHVAWDAMTGLDIEEYKDRGWLDLVYDDGDLLRLDSYHIAKFREIVTEICNRKGFASPFAEKSAAAENAEG